jgi:hypothetical protein
MVCAMLLVMMFHVSLIIEQGAGRLLLLLLVITIAVSTISSYCCIGIYELLPLFLQ